MNEEYYLYQNKLFSTETLREKYGDRLEEAIKKNDFQKAYTYQGKFLKESDLIEKYGDDFQSKIEKAGITPYTVKKNEGLTQESGITSKEKPFSFSEEISNTWNNIVENTKTLDDRAQLLMNRVLEPIENAVTDEPNALRLASNLTSLEELDKSAQKIKPTQSISDAFASGDSDRIAAAVVTSVMQMGESVTKTVASGGLYPFIESPSSLYYQTLQEKANMEGKEPFSIILSNEDELAIPATAGVISAAFEKFGVDKVTKGMLSNAPMGFWKKLTDVGKSGSIEGVTESIQSVIEQVGEQVANGKDIDIAWKEVLDSGLTGMVGGSSVKGSVNTINAAKNKLQVKSKVAQENTQTEQETTEEVSQVTEEQINEPLEQIEPKSPEAMEEVVQIPEPTPIQQEEIVNTEQNNESQQASVEDTQKAELEEKLKTGEKKVSKTAERLLSDDKYKSMFKEVSENKEYEAQSREKANTLSDTIIKDSVKELGVKEGLSQVADLYIAEKIPDIMTGPVAYKLMTRLQEEGLTTKNTEVYNKFKEQGTSSATLLSSRTASASPEAAVSIAFANLDERNMEAISKIKTKEGVPVLEALDNVKTELAKVKQDFESYKKTNKALPIKKVTGQALIKKAKNKRKAGLELINKSLKQSRGKINSGIPLDSDLFQGLKQVFESYLMETRGNVQLAFEKLKGDVKGKLDSDVILEDYKEALAENNQEVIDEIIRDEQVRILKTFIKNTRKSKKELNNVTTKDIEALVDQYNETGEINSDKIVEFSPEFSKLEVVSPETRKEIFSDTRQISELQTQGKQIEASKRYENLQNKLLDLKIEKRSKEDLIYDLWYTNTLSGLTTINRSVLGSSLTVFMSNATRALTSPLASIQALKPFLSNITKALPIYEKVLRTGDAEVAFRDYKQSTPSYLKKVVNTSYGKLNAKDSAAKAFFSLPVYLFRNILAADAVLTFASSDFNYTIREYNDILETDKTRRGIYNKVRKRRADEKVKEAKQQAIEEYEFLKKEEPQLAKELGKSYPILRQREIIDQARNQETVKQAFIDAKESALVSSPKGYLGKTYKAIDSFIAPKESSSKLGNTTRMMMKLIGFPFLRVFFNYMNMSLQYTPIGAVKALPLNFNKTIWTTEGDKTVSNLERQEMAVRSAIGSTLALSVYASVFSRDEEDELVLNEDSWIKVSGNMTGNWKDEKKTDGDRKPWSVAFRKSDGTYTRYYSYIDNPIGLMLAPLGILSDDLLYNDFKSNVKGITKKKREQNIFNLTKGFVYGSYQYAMAQSFNQGLRNIVALIDPSKGDSDKFTDRAAKTLLSPTNNLIMPSAYRQLYNQYKALTDTPEKEITEWYGSAIKNIPFAESFFRNDKYDVFGYPIIRDFDFPLVPDIALKGIKDNLDYRDNLKEWKLLRKYPQVIVSNFELPKSIKKNYNIYESKKSEFLELAGTNFRRMVDQNYSRLDKMDAEKLQKYLNLYRTTARKKAINRLDLIKE